MAKVKTININEPIWDRLKEFCKKNRLKVGAVAGDLIAEGLQKRTTKK